MGRKPRGQLSLISPPSTPAYTCLHRPSDNMGLRDGVRNLLSPPPKDRRARSEARSEAASNADPGEVGSGVPRPAKSSPDLRIGSPTLPTPGPSTPRDQESKGLSTTLFRVIHLTISSRDTDRHAVFDKIRSVFKSGRSKHPISSDDNTADPASVHDNELSWKSTVYPATKFAIDVVKETSGACPPLKGVAAGLSVVLKYCDV